LTLRWQRMFQKTLATQDSVKAQVFLFMSIKYFCERCKKELPEPYCLYTTGHILCGICLPKFIQENKVGEVVVLPHPILK